MAKKDKKRKNSRLVIKPVPVNCPFDKTDTSPDYKDIATLSKFMSDRAKVLGKDRTGICAKHQRKLTLAIKRARHLALLPFVPQM